MPGLIKKPKNRLLPTFSLYCTLNRQMGCFMLSSQLSHHGQSEKSIISTDNMSDFSYHLMLSSFIGCFNFQLDRFLLQ